MTVAELIERLKALPPEATIHAGEQTGGGGEIWAFSGRDYIPIWTEGPDEPGAHA